MTVAELIQKLSRCDQCVEVVYYDREDGQVPVTRISEWRSDLMAFVEIFCDSP